MKYSDQMADWLVELGYTHCFYVGGGNIMHLVESLSRKLDCRAVIHEVAAGIAAEYFNETANGNKALALVTAGPGMTNIITAMAGAYLESRELLVIGGQVKTADLAHGRLRQNGIQEIDGVSIAKPLSTKSECMLAPWDKRVFADFISATENGRKGPVFLEVPLDIQAKNTEYVNEENVDTCLDLPIIDETSIFNIVEKIRSARRPMIMIGGGVDRCTANALQKLISHTSVPVVTTWNGIDRIGAEHPNYVGRPNTWGQRSANILMQQSDLLIAIGTRLGMQQTGFNWQEFVSVGKVIQVDVSQAELEKGHPNIEAGYAVDANDFIKRLYDHDLGNHSDWLGFCKEVRAVLPLVEKESNSKNADYVSPHALVAKLSDLCRFDDVVIPCSSGSAFTIMMQVFEQKFGQKIVTNKGLASMGYGLSGAIGASIANPSKRTILVEGDGGFAQNIQEIGTAMINRCNLKMFIFDDAGYASIRMTQRSYFGGKYVGCDTSTGLGLPHWETLFSAWGVKAVRIDINAFVNESFVDDFNAIGPVAFIVSIDPDQTYFPKITSRVAEDGGMVSNPLHLMTPALESPVKEQVFKYIKVD
jgi:acetolactate synthase-1/2/3 large subunit